MNCIVISGSRNPEGQTGRVAAAFAEGVTQAGGRVETIFLPTMNVERCRQCDADGWGLCRREHRCTIEDDFAGVVDKLRASDAAAFVTPVYYSDLSESLRAFLDRLRRIASRSEDKAGMKGRPAVGICVAGGGGGGAPECTVSLQQALRTTGFDVLDVVPARRQNLEHKLGVLASTGRWFASAVAGA